VYTEAEVASFLDYLQDLFLALFSRTPQEAEKRRALRSLAEKLRQVQPPVYRRSTGHLLPAFGYSLLQLSYLLTPLGELFAKTVNNADPRLAERYRDYLAIARLPEAQASRLPEFGYQAVHARCLASGSPVKELERIGEEFDQFIACLAGPVFYSFDLDNMATDRLSSLCRHELGRFFALFEPGFNPAQKGRKPNFQPVPVKKALKELLDLYFILAGIELSEGLERNLFALLDRLERERAQASREKVRTILARLAKLLERELQPQLLLSLIRVAQADPQLVPQTMGEERPILHEVRDHLSSCFQKDCERVRWDINENAIGGDLKTLFAGAELLEVAGYDEETAKELATREYDGFTRIKPLRILKSFLLAHFEKSLRDPLKRLLIEGTFGNRIFENMCNNTLHGCEELLARLQQLEERLHGGVTAAEKLVRYLELHDQGKPVAPLVIKTVDAVEQDVRRLVDEGTSFFYNLSVLLTETLDDARQKAPALVTNIKSIAGRLNKEYLASLATGLGSLKLFIKIMRNFTEIRENLAAAAPRT